MPALSPTMEEGTLAKWLVKEGDAVKSGDILAEIETDKATMEFEAVDEGTIAQILVAEGTDEVKVGTVIALIAGEGEDAAASPAAPAAAAAEPAPKPSRSRAAAEKPRAADRRTTGGPARWPPPARADVADPDVPEGTEMVKHHRPRGAARRDGRGDARRRPRLRDGRGSRRISGRLQGHPGAARRVRRRSA